jgi:hypothetical protein
MKQLFLAIVAAVTLSACVVHEDRGPVRESYDPHRDWWAGRHQGSDYNRESAEREHRVYCGRTRDASCEGWFH